MQNYDMDRLGKHGKFIRRVRFKQNHLRIACEWTILDMIGGRLAAQANPSVGAQTL